MNGRRGKETTAVLDMGLSDDGPAYEPIVKGRLTYALKDPERASSSKAIQDTVTFVVKRNAPHFTDDERRYGDRQFYDSDLVEVIVVNQFGR